jgi:hypothetical protein
MNTFARTSTAKTIELTNIHRPFSFFDFIESRFRGLPSLHRIFSQVRASNGQTMVVEEIETPDDIAQENEDIRRRYADFAETKSFRISFFTKAFKSHRGLATVNNNEFIGYAIVKGDKVPSVSAEMRWRVYESVIRAFRHDNNFIRGEQNWECSINNCQFRVMGYLYAQQNNMTNVCAHVALRTAAARFHPSGDMSYREMNTLLGVDHQIKKTGGPDGLGLETNEMLRVLEQAGANCFVGDYSTPSSWPVPFDKYIYGSVESGYPAIIIFATTSTLGDHHAVPIIGHTFNEDAWVASADLSYFRVGAGTMYIPSDSWLSTYIAHDDNWGSNFCIPRRYLETKRPCPELTPPSSFCLEDKKGIAYVIGTVPKSVKLNPIQAEVIGADYLFTMLPQMPDTASGRWRQRLDRYAQAHRLVLRPILITGADYARHLSEIRDWNGHRIDPKLVSSLKENIISGHVWMIELSIPELFSANRRKIGEVLLRSDIEPGVTRDLNSFLLARVPGHFALYDSGDASNPTYKFIPCGADSHVELYGCEEKTR